MAETFFNLMTVQCIGYGIADLSPATSWQMISLYLMFLYRL